MKYFNFSWYLILCLACFTYRTSAQDIKVEAKLDKTSIALGDQTNLHLNAHLPIKAQIDFPVLTDTISSKVQIVQMGKIDTVLDQNNPGTRIISRQYTITSFDAGLHMIPSFVFQSKSRAFNTQALPLEVRAVTIDTTKSVYDIKQPLAVSYSFMDWLRDHWQWLVFPLVGVLLIGGLIYYFIKNRKKGLVRIEEPKPAVLPHTLALDKLNLLKSKKLWQQDQVKLYYSELSDIVREYLEKRYQVKALEQTSEEIFTGLRHLNIAAPYTDKLRQILILADLVKFAKEKPLNTDNEQSMDNAISFVMNTKEINPLSESKALNDNESV